METFLNNFTVTWLFFSAALLCSLAFLAAYVKITPYPEFELIREGNVAAALSLGGALGSAGGYEVGHPERAFSPFDPLQR